MKRKKVDGKFVDTFEYAGYEFVITKCEKIKLYNCHVNGLFVCTKASKKDCFEYITSRSEKTVKEVVGYSLESKKNVRTELSE